MSGCILLIKYRKLKGEYCILIHLSDRRDQIGIGDSKENKKNVLGALRLADKAALDHAFMMRAYRV